MDGNGGEHGSMGRREMRNNVLSLWRTVCGVGDLGSSMHSEWFGMACGVGFYWVEATRLSSSTPLCWYIWDS